jgi:hypothetical protein
MAVSGVADWPSSGLNDVCEYGVVLLLASGPEVRPLGAEAEWLWLCEAGEDEFPDSTLLPVTAEWPASWTTVEAVFEGGL